MQWYDHTISRQEAGGIYMLLGEVAAKHLRVTPEQLHPEIDRFGWARGKLPSDKYVSHFYKQWMRRIEAANDGLDADAPDRILRADRRGRTHAPNSDPPADKSGDMIPDAADPEA
jgi:hypothetical protein